MKCGMYIDWSIGSEPECKLIKTNSGTYHVIHECNDYFSLKDDSREVPFNNVASGPLKFLNQILEEKYGESN